MFPILALLLSNEVYLCICDNNNNNKNKHISTMISTEYIPHLLKKYYLNYNLV
jgi:hypothetical protein